MIMRAEATEIVISIEAIAADNSMGIYVDAGLA
jgi:hypothetical protein